MVSETAVIQHLQLRMALAKDQSKCPFPTYHSNNLTDCGRGTALGLRRSWCLHVLRSAGATHHQAYTPSTTPLIKPNSPSLPSMQETLKSAEPPFGSLPTWHWSARSPSRT